MPSVCALLRVEAHRQHLRRLAGRVSIPEPGLLVRGLLRRHSAPGVRDEFRTWRRLAPGELVAVDLLRRLPLSVGGHTAGEPSAIGDGGAGALEVPGPRGASKGTDGTEDVRLLSLLPPSPLSSMSDRSMLVSRWLSPAARVRGQQSVATSQPARA
jgi:hypothetical protein